MLVNGFSAHVSRKQCIWTDSYKMRQIQRARFNADHLMEAVRFKSLCRRCKADSVVSMTETTGGCRKQNNVA